MSVRAHRVNKIEYGGESFNLYHDDKAIEWLESNTNFFEKLDMDCCGISDVSVEDLKKLVKAKGIDKETTKAILEDIRWAEAEKNDWIQYYCF